MSNNNNEKFEVSGSGGGGKGGGGGSTGAVEDANTLQSRATIRVLEVISEGEIEGLASGDGQSIFFDDTPIIGSDGTANYGSAAYDIRVGLPSQPYMAGFPSAESVTTTNTAFDTDPVAVQVSNSSIDAVRIAISLPNGLKEQDTTNGNLHGSTFTFAVDTKREGGVWQLYSEYTITGKTTTTFEKDYRIEKPTNAGIWSWRVRRVTPVSTSSSLVNNSTLARYTEIEDVKLEYDYTAYVGIAVDAESTGNTVPTRSYLVRGIKCLIPSNYDPIAKTYSGQWNGTFVRAWTDNPAWVLYDLLTNTRYGMGEFIDVNTDVDKFSFYNAAVYNDGYAGTGKYDFPAGSTILPNGGVENAAGELIYGPGSDATEHRFTFNTPIAAQEDALKVLQNIAGTMNAVLMYSEGVIWLCQDRPSDPVIIVSNANVIDGEFTYSSSALQQRHTVARVSWNDKNNNYVSTVATVEDADGIARYGYQPTDFAATGATTEGQAIRAGRWLLDTELRTTEILTYKASLDHFQLRISDVIKVWDEFYTDTPGSGRIKSIVGQKVTLDKAVEVAAGTKLELMLATGQLASLPVAETSGTRSVLTVVGSFPADVAPNAMYLVVSAVKERLFKITNLAIDSNIVTVTAAFYDPNKYARIEEGITIAPPVYSSVDKSTIPPVTNITATPEAFTDPIIGTQLKLRIDWTAPVTTNFVTGYNIKWRFNNSQYTSLYSTQNSFTIDNATSGLYEVQITAISLDGKRSRTAVETFTNGLTGQNDLLPPTSISLVAGHGTGTTFIGSDLFVEWVENNTNQFILNQTVGGYKVELYNAITGVLLRTDTVGYADRSYDYTAVMMERDGGSHRNIRVDIYVLDAFLRPSKTKATATFSNAAPAVPNNLVITECEKALMVNFDYPQESDFAGVLIWMSNTQGFIPSDATLVSDSDSSLITLPGLTGGMPYYLRVAAYDTFGKAVSELNLSSELKRTPLKNNGYAIVDVLPPPTGQEEGTIVYLTTDGKLYRYHSGAWTAAVQATDMTGQLTNEQLSSIAAAKLTGSIVGTQITDGAISTAKIAAGAVTTNEIAAGTITADDIKANTITAAQLQAGTITANELGANAVTTDKIQAGAITAAKLSVNAVNANNIVTNTAVITQTAQISDAIITSAKIAGSIQSDNFSNGAAGWLINRAGSAQFNNIYARGDITATSLNAATGTFSGSLSAATGTFSGSLNAATGTFSGAVNGGAFNVGSYTGYSWPAAGGTGVHIGVNGILIGNANGGRYFQVYTPASDWSNAAIYTNIPAYIEDLQVDTIKIKNNAVTTLAHVTATGVATYGWTTVASCYCDIGSAGAVAIFASVDLDPGGYEQSGESSGMIYGQGAFRIISPTGAVITERSSGPGAFNIPSTIICKGTVSGVYTYQIWTGYGGKANNVNLILFTGKK